MQNEQLRKHHIKSFSKLTISERLSWTFQQRQFLTKFMDPQAKRISNMLRRRGKKYFDIKDVTKS